MNQDATTPGGAERPGPGATAGQPVADGFDEEFDEAAAERLLGELRGVASRRDPVPAAVVELARAAFELRTLDAELAELVADSLVDAAPTLVRGAATGPRLLSFAGGRLAVELQVTGEGDRRSLVGQVVGDPVEAAELEQAAGRLAVAVDQLGRFAVPDAPAGRSRLRLVLPGGTVVMTSWVTF